MCPWPPCVFRPPATRRAALLEGGTSPAASTRIPALACSWLYFTIAAIDSSLGILPASESLVDFRINMNFIVFLLSQFQRSIEFNSPLTSTSNGKRQNRHPPTISPTAL